MVLCILLDMDPVVLETRSVWFEMTGELWMSTDLFKPEMNLDARSLDLASIWLHSILDFLVF